MHTKLSTTRNFIFFVILIALITLFFAIHFFWKGKIVDENGYNSINATLTLSSVTLSLITVVFLWLNYSAQMTRNRTADEESELNRVLDSLYKQIDYTNRVIESDPALSSLSSMIFKDFNAILAFQDQYGTDLNNRLNKIYESVRIMKFLIHSDRISLTRKNYLIKIAEHNIGSSFFFNLKMLSAINTEPNKEPSHLSITLMRLTNFIEPVTEQNELELIKVGNLFSGNDSLNPTG